MDEQQMTVLVERVGDRLEPDVAALVAGAAGRGRARRRRRVTGTAVLAVAAAAVVAVVGYALVPGDAGGDRSGPVATEPTMTPAPTHAGRRQLAPDPSKTGWMLADLLVGDVTQVRSSDYTSIDNGSYLEGSARLDGAQVVVLLERVRGAFSCADCQPVAGGYLSKGTYDERAPGHYATGTRATRAVYYTDDGFSITVTGWNAPERGMAEPVLSEEQVAMIAQDQVWLEEPQ
jgi:hypothetical protein